MTLGAKPKDMSMTKICRYTSKLLHGDYEEGGGVLSKIRFCSLATFEEASELRFAPRSKLDSI